MRLIFFSHFWPTYLPLPYPRKSNILVLFFDHPTLKLDIIYRYALVYNFTWFIITCYVYNLTCHKPAYFHLPKWASFRCLKYLGCITLERRGGWMDIFLLTHKSPRDQLSSNEHDFRPVRKYALFKPQGRHNILTAK